jgi:hypothetical protein
MFLLLGGIGGTPEEHSTHFKSKIAAAMLLFHQIVIIVSLEPARSC